MKDDYRVGVISDTHGILRPAAAAALNGVDLIIHAGDIGKPHVLEALVKIAPVTAVRGNMDYGKWAAKLSKTEVVEVGEILIYVLHDLNDLDLNPAAAGFHAVISGHSHQPSITTKNDVLFVNPGSAGASRFGSVPTVALLKVSRKKLDAELIELKE